MLPCFVTCVSAQGDILTDKAIGTNLRYTQSNAIGMREKDAVQQEVERWLTMTRQVQSVQLRIAVEYPPTRLVNFGKQITVYPQPSIVTGRNCVSDEMGTNQSLSLPFQGTFARIINPNATAIDTTIPHRFEKFYLQLLQ